VLFIEQDDFMEDPPKKFFRLAPGREARLRYAYIVKCETAVKDTQGRITEIHCTYDPETKSGGAQAGRKVKATIHWVSAQHAINADVRLYDRLLSVEDPDEDANGKDWQDYLNPASLEMLPDCKLEPSLKNAQPGDRFQFERLGYFCVDLKDGSPEKPAFNRTVTLKDMWAKISKAGNA
jgi:glutaminyl-tRNA synthetase